MQFLNTEFAALVFDHTVLASCMAPFVLTHISAGSHCPWHIAHLERSKARLLLDLMFHLHVSTDPHPFIGSIGCQASLEHPWFFAWCTLGATLIGGVDLMTASIGQALMSIILVSVLQVLLAARIYAAACSGTCMSSKLHY
jgi:hypothetical protein